MKKILIPIAIYIIILSILLFLVLQEIIDKSLVSKITVFLTATISFIISYKVCSIKGKNGMANGLIIGISIAMISLLIHYILKTDGFDIFFIRGLIFMISGAAGGITGVNKV